METETKKVGSPVLVEVKEAGGNKVISYVL
jgi:hypothetical protein